MKIYNNWSKAEALVNTMTEALVGKDILFIDFKKEDGLSWIEIAVSSILSPAKALEYGYLMEQASGQSVYFHSLGSESVNFILKDVNGVTPDINEYGYPLLEVAQVWAR